MPASWAFGQCVYLVCDLGNVRLDKPKNCIGQTRLHAKQRCNVNTHLIYVGRPHSSVIRALATCKLVVDHNPVSAVERQSSGRPAAAVDESLDAATSTPTKLAGDEHQVAAQALGFPLHLSPPPKQLSAELLNA